MGRRDLLARLGDRSGLDCCCCSSYSSCLKRAVVKRLSCFVLASVACTVVVVDAVACGSHFVVHMPCRSAAADAAAVAVVVAVDCDATMLAMARRSSATNATTPPPVLHSPADFEAVPGVVRGQVVADWQQLQQRRHWRADWPSRRDDCFCRHCLWQGGDAPKWAALRDRVGRWI